MASRRPLPRLIETSDAEPIAPQARDARTTNPDLLPADETIPQIGVIPRDWPSDDAGFLTEVLRCHGLPGGLIERLIGVAAAPQHATRLVDRLAVALAAQFHFLSLEEALQAPMLLFGAHGSGVSTIATKLAARFDERQILVVAAAASPGQCTTELQDNLEALDLSLVLAPDQRALRSIVEGADKRMVVIDAACGAPTDAAIASRLQTYREAAAAQGMLVLSANTGAAEAAAIARAAAKLGTCRMIITQIDTARFIGPALIAADTGKLALVAASVTPQFAFGLRTLTPENLARRLMSAVLRSERWRIAPL